MQSMEKMQLRDIAFAILGCSSKVSSGCAALNAYRGRLRCSALVAVSTPPRSPNLILDPQGQLPAANFGFV